MLVESPWAIDVARCLPLSICHADVYAIIEIDISHIYHGIDTKVAIELESYAIPLLFMAVSMCRRMRRRSTSMNFVIFIIILRPDCYDGVVHDCAPGYDDRTQEK